MILFADKMKRTLFLLALSCACLFVTGHSACLYAQQTATREAAVNHWQLGMKAHSEGDLQQAERFLLTAASAFHELGDQQAEADMLTWLAVLKLESGDVAIANRVLVRARETYGSLMTRPGKFAAMPSIEQMDRISTAMSMHFEAGKYLNKGDFNNTVKLLETILEAVIELNAKKYIGRLQFQVGRIYAVHLADLTKALDFYDKAGKTYELLGDAQKISEIEAFINLAKAGLILSAVDGDVKDAEIHIRTALKTAERLSDSILLKESYYLLALMHFRIRDFNSYLAYADKRITANQIPGNETNLYAVLMDTAKAYAETGRYTTSLEYYLSAAEVAKKIKDADKLKLAEGHSYIVRGMELMALREESSKKAAIDIFSKALQLANDVFDEQIKKEIYLYLASLYYSLAIYDKSSKYYEQVLAYENENTEFRFNILIPLIESLTAIHDDLLALKYAHSANELAEKRGDRAKQAKTALLMAVLHNQMGNYSTAFNYSLLAIKLAKESQNHELQVDGYIELGNGARHLNNIEKAVNHYEQAYRSIKNIDDPEEVMSIGV